MDYRYFLQPHEFSTWSVEPRECESCGEERPGYRGPFVGEDEIDFICEDCLTHGALAELDVIANSGDMEMLREQLQARKPEASPERVAQMVEGRYSELAEHTPPAHLWTPYLWPAHCGDFCRLEKEIGKADVSALAGDEPLHVWLARHLVVAGGDTDSPIEDQFAQLWARLRPDSPLNNEKAYDTTALLFRCLSCSQPVIVASTNPAAV